MRNCLALLHDPEEPHVLVPDGRLIGHFLDIHVKEELHHPEEPLHDIL